MSGMWGADLNALRDLATRFANQSDAVETIRMTLAERVASSTWAGPDHDDFLDAWATVHEPALNACSAALATASKAASSNADAQEAASAADGGGGIAAAVAKGVGAAGAAAAGLAGGAAIGAGAAAIAKGVGNLVGGAKTGDGGLLDKAAEVGAKVAEGIRTMRADKVSDLADGIAERARDFIGGGERPILDRDAIGPISGGERTILEADPIGPRIAPPPGGPEAAHDMSYRYKPGEAPFPIDTGVPIRDGMRELHVNPEETSREGYLKQENFARRYEPQEMRLMPEKTLPEYSLREDTSAKPADSGQVRWYGGTGSAK